MTDELVKRLRAIAEARYKRHAQTATMLEPKPPIEDYCEWQAADAITRLTTERDNAWNSAIEAAEKVANEYASRMRAAYDRQVAILQAGTVPACKADAGECIGSDIRALMKPE